MSSRGIRWDRRIEVALVLVVGIAFGAWREFTFININYQLDHVARHTPFSYAHSMVQAWTSGMDLQALLVVKWTLALLSIALMAGLTIVLARILFGTWKQAVPILLGFAAFAILSLLMHVLARWAAPFELVSVRVSHMLQYPVPLVFVLIAATFPRTEKGSDDQSPPPQL